MTPDQQSAGRASPPPAGGRDLREWAAYSPSRLAELAQRVAHLEREAKQVEDLRRRVAELERRLRE